MSKLVSQISKIGDFSLKNAQLSGHPVEIDETHIIVIAQQVIVEKLKTAWLCQETRFMNPSSA